jgi:hypothetical protein
MSDRRRPADIHKYPRLQAVLGRIALDPVMRVDAGVPPSAIPRADAVVRRDDLLEWPTDTVRHVDRLGLAPLLLSKLKRSSIEVQLVLPPGADASYTPGATAPLVVRQHVEVTALETETIACYWLRRRVSRPDREHHTEQTGTPNESAARNEAGVIYKDVDRVDVTEMVRLLLCPPVENIIPRSLVWPFGDLPRYQQVGVKFLVERDAAILADEMGLGKTVQAIAALRCLVFNGEMGSRLRVLIIAPHAILRQWVDEVEMWAPELSAFVRIISGDRAKRRAVWGTAHAYGIFLTSYEAFRQDFDDGNARDLPGLHAEWDLVLCDEAQKIKNPTTEVSREVKTLRRVRSWAMTGTPLENRFADMVSILEFATKKSGLDEMQEDEALATFHQHTLRRLMSDVGIDIPPKTVHRTLIELDERQMREYERGEVAAKAEVDGARGNLGKLRFAASRHISALMRLCNSGATPPFVSAKLESLLDQLESMASDPEAKALAFSQWVEEPFGLERIRTEIARAHPDWEVLVYKGDMSERARAATLEKFRTDPAARILLISLRAGGSGLNLQAASYVFHFDRWWNPSVELQAEGRAHRRGQTRPVTVYRYVTRDTIEERIDEVLEGKRELFKSLVDDESIEAAEAAMSQLSETEIHKIFGTTREPEIRPGDPEWARFEAACEAALLNDGYEAARTPISGDNGVDVIGRRTDPVGLALLQAKAYTKRIGPDDIRDFIGAVTTFGEKAERAIFASRSGFTPAARAAVAASKEVLIELWDGDEVSRRTKPAKAA